MLAPCFMRWTSHTAVLVSWAGMWGEVTAPRLLPYLPLRTAERPKRNHQHKNAWDVVRGTAKWESLSYVLPKMLQGAMGRLTTHKTGFPLLKESAVWQSCHEHKLTCLENIDLMARFDFQSQRVVASDSITKPMGDPVWILNHTLA